MTEGFYGWKGLADDTSEFNATQFQIKMALRQHRTGIPVRVIAVHGGGVGPAPTVDVQPIVNLTDGRGNQTPAGIVYGVACTRNQGGGNAVINDPKPGDVGHIVVADRDISSAKANNGGQSNPGSRRMGNLADGIYIGAVLNPANPDQYVQFTETGVKVADKNGNVIETSGDAVTITTATLRVTGDVVAGFGGENISLLEHVHSGIERGGADTDPPVSGT
jgi:hypothetical protein